MGLFKKVMLSGIGAVGAVTGSRVLGFGNAGRIRETGTY